MLEPAASLPRPVDLMSENLPPASRRRACLIFNPVSGGASVDHREQFSEVFATLREAGIWAESFETSPDESPAILARRAADSGGFDLIVVAGGDGTVGEVAKGLVGQEIPLGILAQGTFNNLARSLGLPGDLRAACAILAQGRVRRVDVGLANDEHYFFEAAGVGIDAPLFPLGEELKDTHWWSPRPLLRAAGLLWRFQPVRVGFELDRSLGEAYVAPLVPVVPGAPVTSRQPSRVEGQREFDLRAFLVIAANGPYYGSGFTIAPGAVMDDGMFTVSVFRRFSKVELIRHFVSISQGRRRFSPKVDTFRAAELRLTSRSPLPCHVDGRPIGNTPLNLKVLPRALKVIA